VGKGESKAWAESGNEAKTINKGGLHSWDMLRLFTFDFGSQ